MTDAPGIVHEVLGVARESRSTARAARSWNLASDVTSVESAFTPTPLRLGPRQEVRARAYAAGNDLVFADGQFSPATRAGRMLLAHELTHVVQQGGNAHLIQRAPANYPANAPPAQRTGPERDGPRTKSAPAPSADNWIWMLESLRRRSPREFVQILAANEGFFYPILKPYGFRGSWTKDQAYIDNFDAAVKR